MTTEAERIAVVESSVKAVHDDLHAMWGAINDVRSDVTKIRTTDIANLQGGIADVKVLVLTEMARRPSWPVTFALGIMSSGFVGMLVYVATSAAS